MGDIISTVGCSSVVGDIFFHYFSTLRGDIVSAMWVFSTAEVLKLQKMI